MARAAADYGCEVWSTPWLDDWHLRDCALQRTHASILKRCLGVRGSTSTLATLFETGRYPLQISWLLRCCRYWNKLVRLPEGNLLRTVAIANTHFGLIGKHASWSSELCRGLEFACPDTNWADHMLQYETIDVAAVQTAAEAKFAASMDAHKGKPTSTQCTKRKHCVYATWMRPIGTSTHTQLLRFEAASYLKQQLPFSLKRAVARFRLSNSVLKANTDVRRGYRERICGTCTRRSEHPTTKQPIITTFVDNEHHVLFQCTTFDTIRTKYKHLFDSCGRSVRRFMYAAYQVENAAEFCKCITEVMTKLEETRIAPQRINTGETAGQM